VRGINPAPSRHIARPQVAFEADKVGCENAAVYTLGSAAASELGSATALLKKLGDEKDGAKEDAMKAKLVSRLPQLLNL
jgi:hypothetical protein